MKKRLLSIKEVLWCVFVAWAFCIICISPVLYPALAQTSATSLTLKTSWLDGTKASGTVSVKDFDGNTVATLTDNSASNAPAAVFTATVPLALDKSYIVTWSAAHDSNSQFSTPFVVGCSLLGSMHFYCIKSSIASAELDLIMNRSTDPGGFRVRSFTGVLP
jgi:hypothetical protein